jgi:hypothetical protein
MKTSAIWTVVVVLATMVGIHGPCFADGIGSPAKSGGILGALTGSAVATTELSSQHARGISNINVNTNYTFDGALSNGSLHGNAVVGSSNTGVITTTNSINNNTGITTVFQNSGNNSLFQQSTSINITVH